LVCDYVVRLEVELRAVWPEEAATLASDCLLNPDAPMTLDVIAMTEIPGGYTLPDDDEGWQVRFPSGGKPVEAVRWEVATLQWMTTPPTPSTSSCGRDRRTLTNVSVRMSTAASLSPTAISRRSKSSAASIPVAAESLIESTYIHEKRAERLARAVPPRPPRAKKTQSLDRAFLAVRTMRPGGTF
jgi:hypothetical protein